MAEQNGTDLDASGLISQAIRNKRERRSLTAVRDEIAALEETLLADIEAFDLDLAVRNHMVEAPPKARVEVEPAFDFPTIVEDGVGCYSVRTAAAKVASADVAAGTASSGAGLLEQLRGQADARLHAEHQAAVQSARHTETLDGAMRQVFSYLHELAQQLNVVKPPVARCYRLYGNLELADLSWERGVADYRTQTRAEMEAMCRVVMSCHLQGKKPLQVTREGSAIESFRRALIDNGVLFSCEEIRNARRLLEKAIFTLPAEVKIHLNWEADFERGCIVIGTSNLERFGSMRYQLDVAQVDRTLLDDFGRLLLGQPSSFLAHVSRQG